MVSEIQRGIETGKILFGSRQVLKNPENFSKVYVPSDCRDDVLKILKEKEIKIDFSEFTKDEISVKLGLEFHCEVFGVKK